MVLSRNLSYFSSPVWFSLTCSRVKRPNQLGLNITGGEYLLSLRCDRSLCDVEAVFLTFFATKFHSDFKVKYFSHMET